MIVMRTPKGWTGPKEVDGKPVEGTWRCAPSAAVGFSNETGAHPAVWKSG